MAFPNTSTNTVDCQTNQRIRATTTRTTARGSAMNDEQRLQAITEHLLIVRDNLFRGMSKSMQKLQAKSINEVLELPNFIESPQRTWVGLTDDERKTIAEANNALVDDDLFDEIEAKLKEKNT